MTKHRLWLRAHRVGVDLGTQLLEDEAVAILERSAIGGNPVVARAIAAEHIKLVSLGPAVLRTELVRNAMKRIRRLAAVVSLGGLEPTQLDEVVSESFAAAIAAL